MKHILVIIFTLFISLGYAQRNGDSVSIYKDVSLGKLKVLAPKSIDEKLKGTIWAWDNSAMCYVENGSVIEIYFDDVGPNNSSTLSFIDLVNIVDVYIGDGKRIRYNFNTNEKEIQDLRSYEIAYLGEGKPIFLCKEEYQFNKTPFSVQKFIPIDNRLLEQIKIKFCIATTHFTILSRLGVAHDLIFPSSCSMPQTCDKRVELPFPEKKRRRR